MRATFAGCCPSAEVGRFGLVKTFALMRMGVGSEGLTGGGASVIEDLTTRSVTAPVGLVHLLENGGK